MPDLFMSISEWIATAIDSTQAAWCLAALGAAVPVAIAGAWLIDHLPRPTRKAQP